MNSEMFKKADKLALLAFILLLADVPPTYSSGLPQGNGGKCYDATCVSKRTAF